MRPDEHKKKRSNQYKKKHGISDKRDKDTEAKSKAASTGKPQEHETNSGGAESESRQVLTK